MLVEGLKYLCFIDCFRKGVGSGKWFAAPDKRVEQSANFAPTWRNIFPATSSKQPEKHPQISTSLKGYQDPDYDRIPILKIFLKTTGFFGVS